MFLEHMNELSNPDQSFFDINPALVHSDRTILMVSKYLQCKTAAFRKL